MKFQVLCYDKLHMCHLVRLLKSDDTEDTSTLQPLYLDLTVDNSFPEYKEGDNIDGRIIEVSEIIPYVGLAVNTKFVQ